MKAYLNMMDSNDLDNHFIKRGNCVAIIRHNRKTCYAISIEDGAKSNKFATEIEIIIGNKDM